jgi:hypothetical protein
MDALQNNGAYRYRSTDEAIRKDPAEQKLITADWGVVAPHAAGWIDIATDVDEIFKIKLTVLLGRVQDSQTILAPPHSTQEFYRKLVGAEDDPRVVGTQILLHGAIKTGGRLIEMALSKFPPYFFDK